MLNLTNIPKIYNSICSYSSTILFWVGSKSMYKSPISMGWKKISGFGDRDQQRWL